MGKFFYYCEYCGGETKFHRRKAKGRDTYDCYTGKEVKKYYIIKACKNKTFNMGCGRIPDYHYMDEYGGGYLMLGAWYSRNGQTMAEHSKSFENSAGWVEAIAKWEQQPDSTLWEWEQNQPTPWNRFCGWLGELVG